MKFNAFDKVADTNTTTYELDEFGNLAHEFYYNEDTDYIDTRKTAFGMDVVPLKQGEVTQRCFILKNKQKQSTPLLLKMHMHREPIKDSLQHVMCSIANADSQNPSHLYVNLSTGAISEPFHYVNGLVVDKSGAIVTLNPDLTFTSTGFNYENTITFAKEDSKGVVTTSNSAYEAVVRDSAGRYRVIQNYGSRDTLPTMKSDYSFDSPNITMQYITRKVKNPQPYTIYHYDNIVEFRTETTKVLQETITGSTLQAVPIDKEYDFKGYANFEEYYTAFVTPILQQKEEEKRLREKQEREARMEERTVTAAKRVDAKPLKSDKLDKLSAKLITKKPVHKPRRPIKEVLADIGEVTLDILTFLPELFSDIGSCDRSSEYSESEKLGGAFLASQLLDSPIAGMYAYHQMEGRNEEIRAEKARKEKESSPKSMDPYDY